MREDSRREDGQGGGHRRKLRTKELSHMSGKGQHQRIQELQVRHEQQSDTGAMEQNENKCPVHELVNPGEDRQAVHHPDGSECEGTQGVEQIGSGSNLTRPGLAVRTIEQANAGSVGNGSGTQ
eukprot:14365529-Heterocapsa_arctica.AAC.1